LRIGVDELVMVDDRHHQLGDDVSDLLLVFELVLMVVDFLGELLLLLCVLLLVLMRKERVV
jgi:hypothetical protein